jgi:oxygen-dependent protoporphyrinogen oxidase
MTHVSAKWEWVRTAYGPGRHLVRLSYGRNGRVDEPMAELPEIALADLRAITGAEDIDVEESRVIRWDRSLVRPAPGHRDRVAAIRSATEAVTGLSVIGAGLGGNGLAGTIAAAQTRGRMNQ